MGVRLVAERRTAVDCGSTVGVDVSSRGDPVVALGVGETSRADIGVDRGAEGVGAAAGMVSGAL